MTRDEATETLYKIHYPDDFRFGGAVLAAKNAENKKSVERHVAGLVALGILKLDEPKSVADRMCDVLKTLRLHCTSPQSLLDIFDQAGLKIVEK